MLKLQKRRSLLFDNETVALEKVEDLETISSILEEYGYSTEEVGSVYKYTVWIGYN